MANFIKKYDSVSQYNSDSEKQYPNISYIEDTGELKWMKALQFETVYTVDDASQPVTLFNDNGAFTGMEVDGNEVPLSDTYTFPATGEHVVKYSLNDNSAIGSGTFTDVTALTGVTFPPTVENIGLEAFKGCTGLTSITLPSGAMRTLGTSSFEDCTSLSSVTIEYSLYEIGQAAFKGCTSLTSINIPDSVGSIGEEAFKNSGLTGDVYLPSPVRTISDRCFEGCANLTGVIYQGNYPYVYSIGNNAFKNCTSLTRCDYLNSTNKTSNVNNVTDIGMSAFEGCTSLTEIVINAEIQTIKYDTFKNCTNLESIVISGTVTSIQNGAFTGCPNLKRVEFNNFEPNVNFNLDGAFDANVVGRKFICPYTTEDLYKETFVNYANEIEETYKQIFVSSVYMGGSYFNYLSKLCNFKDGDVWTKFDGTYDEFISRDTRYRQSLALGYWQQKYFAQHPKASYTQIPNIPKPQIDENTQWMTVTYNVTDTENPTRISANDTFLGMKVDGGETQETSASYQFDTEGIHTVQFALENPKYLNLAAFDNGRNRNIPIVSVTLPNTIKKIDGMNFKGCQTLESITFPDSVKVICTSAFGDCSNLASVTLPASPEYVASTAFAGTAWLNNQPDGMMYIGNTAYYYKNSDVQPDTTIELRSGTTVIGVNCFNPDGNRITPASNITQVILPSSVTEIRDTNFYSGFTGMKTINLGNVMKINSSTFHNCNSLTSVQFNNAAVINSESFRYCSALTTVDLPFEIIESETFRYCDSLETVTIGSNCKSISTFAVINNPNLVSVTINATTPPKLTELWGGNPFRDNNQSMKIYVPAESVEAYKAAKGWRNVASRIQAIPSV